MLYFFNHIFYFFIFFWREKKCELVNNPKMGSDSCPLFTVLTTKISQVVLDYKLCKEEKGKWSHYLRQPTLFKEKRSAFTGDLPFWRKTVYFHGRPIHTLILTLVYFHGRLTYTYSKWSIFRGNQPTNSRLQWSIFVGDLPYILKVVYF